jgi:hypothetical protein
MRLFYLTDMNKISETINSMSNIPRPKFMKDPEPVGYHGHPPPKYDHQTPYPQPAAGPSSQHNGK